MDTEVSDKAVYSVNAAGVQNYGRVGNLPGNLLAAGATPVDDRVTPYATSDRQPMQPLLPQFAMADNMSGREKRSLAVAASEFLSNQLTEQNITPHLVTPYNGVKTRETNLSR